MKSDVTAMTNAFVITERIPMPSRIPYQIPVQQGGYVSSRKNKNPSAWDTAWSEALVPTTQSLLISIWESLSKNNCSYWTARLQWTRFLLPLGGNFVDPANNLKEAAKMLMETLNHITMWVVLRNTVILPGYDDSYPVFEEGLPGQPWIYAIHDLPITGTFCVTCAQLVSMYLLATKSSWHPNAIQWHTALKHHLGFLAHPQSSDRYVVQAYSNSGHEDHQQETHQRQVRHSHWF